MKFNVRAEFEYTAFSAGTIILNIHALKSFHQLILDESFNVDPFLNIEEFSAVKGENRI